MSTTKPNEFRAGSIAMLVKASLIEHFGETYPQRVTYYETLPKGLFREGKLYVPAGLKQSLNFYGKLTEIEIDTLLGLLRTKIDATRSTDFTPIEVNFYFEEVIQKGPGGSSVRGVERLLRTQIITTHK
jgi:hypothetical protein